MTLSLYAMFRSYSICRLMWRPLHRTQVDTLLVHFPQGGQLAQLGDLAADELHREVDLFLGREAPESEADRAVRQLVRASQGPQHIRGLETRRGARRARGHRHVLDRHDERLALDEIEAHVEVVRRAALHVAVHVDLLEVPDAVP